MPPTGRGVKAVPTAPLDPKRERVRGGACATGCKWIRSVSECNILKTGRSFRAVPKVDIRGQGAAPLV